MESAMGWQDPRWRQLDHAYGDGSDIPDLLQRLEQDPSAWGMVTTRRRSTRRLQGHLLTAIFGPEHMPPGWSAEEIVAVMEEKAEDERRRSDAGAILYDALYHQTTVYTASFAAFPHLIRIARGMGGPIPYLFYDLVKGIAGARHHATDVLSRLPDDLRDWYIAALPGLDTLRPVRRRGR